MDKIGWGSPKWWTTLLDRCDERSLRFGASPEGPEATLATAITSRSTPREGSFGFLLVIGPALLALAVVAAVAAVLLLRSLGDRYRVGRTLAAAHVVGIDEARQLAAGPARYVRVEGRISSDEEFPDESDRPLVFRRKRIDAMDSSGHWQTVADEKEAVPFGLETRSEFIAVDVDSIGPGLVAIPRESVGKWSDLPTGIAGDDDQPRSADTPTRLVIEQLSAVEHATVCGTPVLRDGQPTMTAGNGRPLIVTTLDQASAMRLWLPANGRA